MTRAWRRTPHLTTAIAYSNQLAYKTQAKGFNVFGSSLGETVTIPGTDALAGDYIFTHTYYPNNGLLFRDAYPAKGSLPAETVVYGYDTFDQVETVAGLAGYLQDVTEDAYGRINQAVIGSTTNKAALSNTFDEHNGLLTQQKVTRTPTIPGDIDTQDYKYDLVGNLIKQTSTRHAANGIGETQCFGYDQLRRLTEAWTATDSCATVPSAANKTMVGNTIGGGSAYWTSWALDDLGNRTSQVQHSLSAGVDTSTNYTYNGNGSGQPHTLTSTSTTGGTTGSSSYAYNAAGQMSSRNAGNGNGNQTLTWTDNGKLGTVTNASGTSTSIYNADGSLLLQKDPGAATLYLNGQQLVLNTATGTVTGTRYIALPGGATVIRSGTGTNYSFAIGDLHGTPTLYLNNTAQTPPGASTAHTAASGEPP